MKSPVSGCFELNLRGRLRRRARGLGIVVFFALGPLSRVDVLCAATITVTSLADDTNIDGQVTLREAIQAANTDLSVDGSTAGNGADHILFATGAGTITLNGTQLPTIIEDLAITGPGATDLVIDAAGGSRVIEIEPGVQVTLSGLSITGGTVTSGDGGGGIHNAGTLTLTACSLSGNATTIDGGGIYNTGTLEIGDSTLAGNSALNGGGIYNENGSVTIAQSSLVANFTGGIAPFAGGGGAILNGGSLFIRDSTLSGNTAGNGGAILSGPVLGITNSTLSANEALNSGGGIRCGSAAITHSTLTANRSNTNNNSFGNGGGIEVSSGSSVLLEGTVVAGNFNGTGTTAVDVYGAADPASSFNLVGVDTGLTGISNGVSGNQIGSAAAALDPMLGLLQDNGGPTFTHEPLGGSPAIDTAAFSTSVSTDQRGVTRPQGSEADIGAVEVFVPTAPPADLVLQNETFNAFEVIEACNSITAELNVQVSSSGNVLFRAGNTVALKSGFSVEKGGRFFVLIQVPTACLGSFP